MPQVESPIETAAKTYKNNCAFISKEATLSYHDLRCLTDEVLQKIGKLNIINQKTVALLTDNNLHFIILFYALMHSNLKILPLNFRLPPGNQLSQMKEASADTLFTSDNLADNFDETITIINIKELILNLDTNTDRATDLKLNKDSLLTAIATSGSTDRPKLALHSINNYLKSAEGANENMKLETGDRWLLSLPLFHVGGLGILFRSLLAGITVVIPDKKISLAENIEKYKITHISVVFSQLIQLLNDKNEKQLKRLKAVLAGGGPIPSNLLEQALAINLPLYLSYGSTEMCSQITTTDAPVTSDNINSGKTLKFREILISDEAEILVKGETMFDGYLRNGRITRELDKKGWFHTGDLGKWDKNNKLVIVGRKDNQFISGGENIQPEEIEKIILQYDGTDEAIVVGINHPTYGQIPFAFVSGRFDNSELKDYLNNQLPKYKLPVGFAPLPISSDSTLQKPDRKRLKELAEQIITRKNL